MMKENKTDRSSSRRRKENKEKKWKGHESSIKKESRKKE